MTTGPIARVAIVSPLPQLDRLFDYRVPAEFAHFLLPGQRVRVPFGRGTALHDGFIVEIAEQSDFDGALSNVVEIVSEAPVLTSEIFQLARSVADRQAATLSDVLRLAIPDRSVAVEKKWLGTNQALDNSSAPLKGKRETAILRPTILEGIPEWVRVICDQAISSQQQGRSAIIVVPDFRDQFEVFNYLAKSNSASAVIDYSTTQTKSKRYASFLSCLSNGSVIVVGSRAAIYAPVRNLQQIIIWDDGDSSHQEPSSPYSHSREVALLRQQTQGCDLFIYGHSRSTEVARLISIGFFTDSTRAFPIPKIANSDSDIRVDSMAWRAIRAAIETGPVLIQVAGKGNSGAIYCAECSSRATCRICNGPLWLDQRNISLCRWCSASNLDFKCNTCGSSKLRHGSPGSSRTVAEFGKAFPGIRIIESTGDNPVQSVDNKGTIVISTPGAEPYSPSGFSAVVILDANRALGKDTLRATEDAVRSWANAISRMAPTGQAVLVGVAGILATKFSLWAIAEIANHELASRIELKYPPALRMASIGAERKLLDSLIPEVAKLKGVEILGPVSIMDRGVESEARLLIKYEYSQGPNLAAELKAQALKFSAGQQRFSAKSGRSMRPIRVKMDDVEVI